MGYTLGVDLGGPEPVAAVGHPDGSSSVVVGLPAATLTDAVDRLGTPQDGWDGVGTAPLVLADAVARCVGHAAATRRDRPSDLVVSHPAAWGPYRVGLLADALRGHDLPPWRLLPDTVAIARQAAATDPRLALGPCRLAVVDIRDEQTSVGVVAVAGDAQPAPPPRLVGPVRVVAELASADLDDAVLAHTVAVAADLGLLDASGLTPDAAERLRAACRSAADEVLTAGSAVVGYPAPDGARPIRSVLADVEPRLHDRSRHAVAQVAAAVGRLAPAGVDAVVLCGRLAAMPLLTELVAERFDAPVTVVPGGDTVAARGAATAAALLRPEPAADRTAVPRPRDTDAAAAEGDAAHRHGRRRAPVRSRPSSRPLRATAAAWIGTLVLGVLAAAVADDAVARSDHGHDAPAGVVVTDPPPPGTSRG
ncbi:hypothetical protein [uncultured Cellulomonas sp.]|uniref:hypothetical protein n=1 Tax=uncultured Cellulomonas sp. TaxID=189682 RepID=UPI00262752A4|nr:hypothetical protein [uncultured Cellulomonas sp.]